MTQNMLLAEHRTQLDLLFRRVLLVENRLAQLHPVEIRDLSAALRRAEA